MHSFLWVRQSWERQRTWQCERYELQLSHEKRILDAQMRTIAIQEAWVATSRDNTHMVILTAYAEIAVNKIKNTFEKAKSIKPTPNLENYAQKMHFNAIKEVEALQKL